MPNEIENLKYAAFELDIDDGSNCMTTYVASAGESYEELLQALNDIYEIAAEVADDEDEDLEEFFADKEATEEYISNFEFDTRAINCRCLMLVKGENIADSVISFVNECFDTYLDEDDADSYKYQQVIADAENNPTDIDRVYKLLRITDELIERDLEDQM